MHLRILVLFGLLSASALGAQSPQGGHEQTGPDVVVLGKSRKQIDEQARQFLSSILPKSPSDRAMARYGITKMCPVAIGLTPKFDAMVTERMRQVAKAAGVEVDKIGCQRPSALVLFADDLAPTIALLEKRYVGLFVDQYGMPIHFAKKGPVVVWHLGQDVSQNGEILEREENGGVLINRTARQASRIEEPVHQDYTMTVVLIERNSVEGLTVTQVADYAAMRAYADTRPPQAEPGREQPPTILAAITAPMGGAVPASLTDWDLGFLRGLYSTSPNLRASPQRGEVTSAIARTVMKP